MEIFELILILAAGVLGSSLINQLSTKLSAPLIQIALGCSLSLLLPHIMNLSVEPELFLVLFIAPLLFDETRHTNKTNLWRNRHSIISLAIGLVIALVLVLGFSIHALVPSIPLAAAFALGSALGPTDAVAVSALGSVVALNPRQKALLSGESLINDASGVVAFQFAVAAVVTGGFSLISASQTFLISFLGGILLGIICGLAVLLATQRIKRFGLETTTFHVLFDILVPLIIFLAGEHLHVSGILAVVAAGLILHAGPRTIGPLSSRLNLVSSSTWALISYTLNGIVFLLLGIQLPRIFQNTWQQIQLSYWELLGIIAVMTFILVLVRFIWCYCLEYIDESLGRSPKHPSVFARTRECLITTLAGPKGAITLMIALSLPFITQIGELFPHRNLIIFLASGTILATLLLANFVLPLIAQPGELESTIETRDLEAQRELLRKVIEIVASESNKDNRLAVRSVIRSYNLRIKKLANTHNLKTEDDLDLRIATLRYQQDVLVFEMEQGSLDCAESILYIQHLAHVQNLLKHRRDNSWLIVNIVRHARILLRAALHYILETLPATNPSIQAQKKRDIHIYAEHIAIDFLRKQLTQDHFPNEMVSNLLSEHEHILATLLSSDNLPSITNITQISGQAQPIKKRALEAELELIQQYYEEGRLSRLAAKTMRENVFLMQIDLEQHL